MSTYTVRAVMAPSVEQYDTLTIHLDGCRRLYNTLNSICRTNLMRGLNVPERENMRALAVALASEGPDDSVLENVGDRVSDAYRIFTERSETMGRSTLPRFKASSRYRSMTFGRESYLVSEGAILLSGIGIVPFGGISICRERGRGYVPVPSCRVCAGMDRTWRTDITFDMDGFDGMGPITEGEWETIDWESMIGILEAASESGEWLLGYMSADVGDRTGDPESNAIESDA